MDTRESPGSLLYEGNACSLRLIEAEDAADLLALRSDPVLSRFLSKVNATVEAQAEWIRSYKERERAGMEFYFAVVEDGKFVGTTRIYDIDFGARIFTGGSWVVRSPSNPVAAVESILATYSFAFDGLGMDVDVFEVRRDNAKVVAFQKECGARLVYENDVDLRFIRTARMFGDYVSRMERIVPIRRFSGAEAASLLEARGIPRLVRD